MDLDEPESFEPVFEHSSGDYQRSERESLSEMHAKRYVRGGQIRVLWLKGQAVSADGTVVIRTCDDVSGTTFEDENGQSLVPPERPRTVALDLAFEGQGTELFLVSADPVEDDSCVV